MVESRCVGFTTEAALFDSGKLEVQISKDSVIVHEHCARFELIGEGLGATTIFSPDGGAQAKW